MYRTLRKNIMKEITHHKYSIFFLEEFIDREYAQIGTYLSKPCFEYIDTYDTLEEAQSTQKEFKNKSIIIPTY